MLKSVSKELRMCQNEMVTKHKILGIHLLNFTPSKLNIFLSDKV